MLPLLPQLSRVMSKQEAAPCVVSSWQLRCLDGVSAHILPNVHDLYYLLTIFFGNQNYQMRTEGRSQNEVVTFSFLRSILCILIVNSGVHEIIFSSLTTSCVIHISSPVSLGQIWANLEHTSTIIVSYRVVFNGHFTLEDAELFEFIYSRKSAFYQRALQCFREEKKKLLKKCQRYSKAISEKQTKNF